MDDLKSEFENFIIRFKNAKLVNAVRIIEEKSSYIVFAVAVGAEGILPSVDVANFNLVYPLFFVNKFGEYKFVKVNIIDVIEESIHNFYWQVYYKF